MHQAGPKPGITATIAASILALGGLSACAAGDRQEVAETGSAVSASSPFSQALAADYQSFTAFEANEMYDWGDAEHFAEKSLRAAQGVPVPPESLEDWDLPPEKTDELGSARIRLIEARDGGAAERLPRLLARAQSRFDCWIEQQEENHQPAHIAICRDGFYEAISTVEQRLTARQLEEEPSPAAAAPRPERVVVYFDFDSAELSPQAEAVVKRAAASAKADGSALQATGYSDRAGPPQYNRDLSLRRAENVKQLLQREGVPGSEINVAARGENDLAVPTGDDVVMPPNRRVELALE